MSLQQDPPGLNQSEEGQDVADVVQEAMADRALVDHPGADSRETPRAVIAIAELRGALEHKRDDIWLTVPER